MARVMTSVNAVVATQREAEFLEGFRELNAETKPAGLLRSELLKGQNGNWRIQTVWRDRDCLLAVRATGRPPAALELFDRVGAEHSHEVFSVEESWEDHAPA